MPGDADIAAGRLLESRQQVQDRRLAAPGRPEQAEELAAIDLEREAQQDRGRRPGTRGETEVDTGELDEGSRGF